MSAELTAWASNAAKGLRDSYVLLENAANTVAGGSQTINYNGEHIVDIQGSFGTAAQVNIYCKRVGADNFQIIKSLSSGLTSQYTEAGNDILSFSHGDQVYAQLSGITGTPSIDVRLTYSQGN